ncbi:MAG: tRNA dimethylallyltransferase [Solirubrobacteraceae bacterium]|jgi:tRNA dimethylallyltransferase|nr:tRNA dimethylallyltransferase [Solirubrobacteraceae bacterium]
MPGRLVAIFGPTGVGKTAVALSLATAMRADGQHPAAVSADALQVYRGIETLTGVPTPAQQAILEHRLISFVALTDHFDVARYAALAHAEIDGLLAEGRRPIVIGGTGLYLRAALTDLRLRPAAPPAVRARWKAALDRDGPHALHALLADRAPWAAERIDPADRHRIVRALELQEINALEPPSGPSQLWTADCRHPTRLIGLVMDRGSLYRRIDDRVERMVAGGALEEVRTADRAGASPGVRQALGFAALLAGDVEAMKRQSRNYARRQLTWMRKLAGVEIVDVTDRSADDVAAALR